MFAPQSILRKDESSFLSRLSEPCVLFPFNSFSVSTFFSAFIMFMSSYKATRPFEVRKADAYQLLSKFPDRIPVIIEPIEGSDLPRLLRQKFSIDRNQQFASLQIAVKQKLVYLMIIFLCY